MENVSPYSTRRVTLNGKHLNWNDFSLGNLFLSRFAPGVVVANLGARGKHV